MAKEEIERRARADEKVRALIEGKQVMKTIVVPDKLVNFVVK
jgi:leucyl-tRNA synthetase